MFLFLHVQAGSVQIASRVYNIQVVTPGELVEERSLRFCRPDARQAIGGCGVERSRLSLGSKVQTNLDTIPICLWINGTKIGMVSCSFVCLYSLCIFFFGIIYFKHVRIDDVISRICACVERGRYNCFLLGGTTFFALRKTNAKFSDCLSNGEGE